MGRRFAATGGVVALAALAALLRVFAPGRFDRVVDSGAAVVEQTPDPVVLGVTVIVLTLVCVVLFVYVIRVYYWVWLRVEGPVTRFWNALLPESPIIRFGVGLTLMIAVFLVGPLVVLQTLDFFGDTEDPVEDRQTDPDDEDENTTDSEAGDADTAAVHAADEPDSPDEPPGIRTPAGLSYSG